MADYVAYRDLEFDMSWRTRLKIPQTDCKPPNNSKKYIRKSQLENGWATFANLSKLDAKFNSLFFVGRWI